MLASQISKAYFYCMEYGTYSVGDSKVITDPSTEWTNYQNWKNVGMVGNLPLLWPKDASGNQTVAALDAVLTHYGLPASGITP